MSEHELLDIGEVIAQAGVPATTLHVWERHGLITPVARRGLRRQYDPEVLDTIALVVVCSRSGFTLAEIAGLLAPNAFRGGKEVLADKLRELERRQAQITIAIDGLRHALACPAPSPLECDGFRRHLVGVLPVSRSERERSA